MLFPNYASAEPFSVAEQVQQAFLDEPVMMRIAWCESGLKQFEGGKLLRGAQNPKDVGIFQINERYHLQNAKNKGIDIYTVKGNIAYAKLLYEDAGTKPWEASRQCWQGIKTV